jgi:hypothetical protein
MGHFKKAANKSDATFMEETYSFSQSGMDESAKSSLSARLQTPDKDSGRMGPIAPCSKMKTHL